MPNAITAAILAKLHAVTNTDKMKKIFCIGECALDIVFRNAQPVGSMPGGRIVNAAAILARQGLPVSLVSELSKGSVGDIIYDFLSQAGVETSSVDRFTEGLSPIIIYTTDENGIVSVTRYEQYPDQCFDVVWPRIDEHDIIIYGGFYALDPRMRPRMSQLLSHAAERKAILIYLPGFLPQQEPRITRVMPAILENLEYASAVIVRNNDLETIFGASDGDRCYHDHITFYCRSLINIDTAERRINYYSGKEVTSVEITEEICTSMMWNAGAVAGIVDALYCDADAASHLEAPDEAFRRAVLSKAALTANNAAKNLTADWQKLH